MPVFRTNDTYLFASFFFSHLLCIPWNTGCVYQGTKYSHADQVITSEPCLNCTCKRGVLLCFLKVCPTLMHHHLTTSSPDDVCTTIREVGQCCPVVKCESQSSFNATPSTTTLYTTSINEWNTPLTTVSTIVHDHKHYPSFYHHREDEGHGSDNNIVRSHGSTVQISPGSLVHPSSSSSQTVTTGECSLLIDLKGKSSWEKHWHFKSGTKEGNKQSRMKHQNNRTVFTCLEVKERGRVVFS